jgi:ElaB/YqjD/DUF883 family membrane-anchored ribosome-binding protein
MLPGIGSALRLALLRFSVNSPNQLSERAMNATHSHEAERSDGKAGLHGNAGMQGAKVAAEDTLNDLKERANEYLEFGREKALTMTEVVGDQIRRRPVEAVVIAAGIGFALGFLWTRRS